ncbi:MAG TPA: hypothetical protein VK601_30240, partial [Kofleriaceae bacterium]|nr:hypothetical protein [Kofleriaceae bacterium]
MRAIAICAVLAGCGQPEATPVARGPVTAGSAARDVTGQGAPAGPATPPPPAFRLPDGVAPVSYDLTLALDADRD